MTVLSQVELAGRARDAAIAEEERAREAYVAATEKVRLTTEVLDALICPAPPAASPATSPVRASGSASPAAPAPFVQLCSCLKCCEGQATGRRDRVSITMGHASYCAEDGYMKEHAGDQSKSVRCVECCKCEKGRWYLSEHMGVTEWYNTNYVRRTTGAKKNFYCVECWPNTTA